MANKIPRVRNLTMKDIKAEIKKLQDIFESITCLCAEGPEFMKKQELMEAIGKEALKGYCSCKNYLTQKGGDAL